MGDDVFDEKILTEKLSKLNNSQQSIESVSRWCVLHRKRAKGVVEIWERSFKSARQEQRVSLLYLANDILQNSRRKGSEFMNEFWKILPSTLKGVYDSGDDICRKAASRLVDIWEERKVFGSRGQNLKNEVLGIISSSANSLKNPSFIISGKTSNPVKIVKRDANSLRIKLAVGGSPEKILTAFHSVYNEVLNEESSLNKCQTAVSCMQELEIDVVNVSSQGNKLGSDVVDNIKKQENILQQCIRELENVESIRADLVSQLRDALQDQESKLELIRSELQVARIQVEKASEVNRRLVSPAQFTDNTGLVVKNLAAPPASLPFTSFVTSINEEDIKKATAAAVAAKLTASSSSALMFTSVLSSFVAEEAASRSSGLKKPKLESSMPLSGVHTANSTFFSNSPQSGLHAVQSSGIQSLSQINPLQSPFHMPPPTPPPLAPPTNSTVNQIVQSTMIGLPPYSYGASKLQHPALPSNISVMGSSTQQQHLNLQNKQAQQQPSANVGYYRPSGMGLYGYSHQPTTPPIQKQ